MCQQILDQYFSNNFSSFKCFWEQFAHISSFAEENIKEKCLGV